jgi:N-acetylneuraminic acid mutarotase
MSTSKLFIAALVLFFPFVSIQPVFANASKLGTWKTGAPAPTKRTEVAAAAVGGKVYVVGGFSKPSLKNALDYAISRAVEVYDPGSNTWSTTTPLPEGRHHAGIAVVNGALYVIGGFTKSLLSVWKAVPTVYHYNPETASWRELPNMPTARGALGVTVYRDRLYAIGGYDGERNTAVVEVFDPQSNTWSSVASMPTPRDHLAVATVGSRIYAIGGRPNLNYRHNMGIVEEYDPETDQWQSRAKLPTARSGIATGVIDGRIYVLGGESEKGTFATNEVYMPDVDQWHAMAPMPTARHGLGAAMVDGHLYVISGGPAPGGSFSQVNEIFTPPIFSH